jgi:uncharacterized membrane protein
MRPLTSLSLLLVLLLAFLLPLLFYQLMLSGLAKLDLSPGTALTLMIAIIVGGMINIPVKRIGHAETVDVHRLAVYGFSGMLPQLRRARRDTIIAVNVGGCLIPTGLALYELLHLVSIDQSLVMPVALVSAANIALCYSVARPVPGVGIVMPGLVPAIAAAALAFLLARDQAAPVAFIAGVAGPLIGADLFHLREIGRTATGIASIGGAGTFDGIVLSGIVAAYLA